MPAIAKRFTGKSFSLKARIASAFILALACYATPSAAQSALASVTAEERAACTSDVMRLCASQIPSVAGIIACMKSQRSKLSPACAVVFDARVASARTANR
jgi:hypothetical protein